jgi:hypothetical protein
MDGEPSLTSVGAWTAPLPPAIPFASFDPSKMAVGRFEHHPSGCVSSGGGAIPGLPPRRPLPPRSSAPTFRSAYNAPVFYGGVNGHEVLFESPPLRVLYGGLKPLNPNWTATGRGSHTMTNERMTLTVMLDANDASHVAFLDAVVRLESVARAAAISHFPRSPQKFYTLLRKAPRPDAPCGMEFRVCGAAPLVTSFDTSMSMQGRKIVSKVHWRTVTELPPTSVTPAVLPAARPVMAAAAAADDMAARGVEPHIIKALCEPRAKYPALTTRFALVRWPADPEPRYHVRDAPHGAERAVTPQDLEARGTRVVVRFRCPLLYETPVSHGVAVHAVEVLILPPPHEHILPSLEALRLDAEQASAPSDT